VSGSPFDLAPGDIHLWWARVPDLVAADAVALLDADERARAARFVVDPPRQRFIAFRVLARRLLAAYVGQDPATISFLYGPHGKPALDHPRAPAFNAAHSADLVVLAVTRAERVGVDLELLRPMPRAAALAARFFTPAEHAFVAALAGPQRDRSFFHCWTCKEAVLKAIGTGLNLPPRQVEVTPDPEQPSRVLAIPDGDPTCWSLLQAETVPGYLCTLAVEGTGWRVVVRRYRGGDSPRAR